MKRSHEEIKDEQRIKSQGYESSPQSVASPHWKAPSVSPAYRPPKRSRHFRGCSKITAYEFLDKLGEGTFGEVHKARDKHTNQLVALKRILMHNEKEGIPITAIREIKILKQLSHKNIVPLTDIAVERGEASRKEKGSIYMVFPYMDHDLAGLLDNPKVRLTQPQIKTYLRQLLEGTAYLHHNKILHRDMKAANLLINNEGVLQIADFGLARGIEDENKEYTNCVVTRWYRPPELFLGERKYTTAIDMWGVGCVFGELLKSRPILQGQDDLDQLKKIFYLCGSPTQDNMPNWDKLPDANKVKFETTPRHVRDEYGHYDALAGDLMDKLLVLDPAKRLTALEALDHEYFYSTPLPAEPSELPKYEASHEFDRRKVKQPPRHK
ncbi:MAG: kinase-like domain-containing protein [Benjaminiella poitrasii]|nr:MAG: kinase-like domain-containing protein [Benjaminiella poitrasii]